MSGLPIAMGRPDRGLVPLLNRIVEEPLFDFLLAHEVVKSRRLQYSVSVVCLSAAAEGGTLPPLAPRVLDHIRATDVVLESPPSTLTLLLVHAEIEALPAIVHRLTEHLQGFLAPGASLRWSAGGAAYPQTAAGPREVLEQARGLMRRAQEAGGERLYLAAGR